MDIVTIHNVIYCRLSTMVSILCMMEHYQKGIVRILDPGTREFFSSIPGKCIVHISETTIRSITGLKFGPMLKLLELRRNLLPPPSYDNLVWDNGVYVGQYDESTMEEHPHGGHVDDDYVYDHPPSYYDQVSDDHDVHGQQETFNSDLQELGERLYYKVVDVVTMTGRPGKITGMLLQLPVPDIERCIENRDILSEKVTEAYTVLEHDRRMKDFIRVVYS